MSDKDGIAETGTSPGTGAELNQLARALASILANEIQQTRDSETQKKVSPK